MPDLGTDIGGRFRLERPSTEHSSRLVYLGHDLKTKKPVAIWYLPASVIADGEGLEALRESIREAGAISGRNTVPNLGIGPAPDGAVFVAREAVDGAVLFTLCRAKQRQDKAFSPRGAFNLLSQVSQALSAAPPGVHHGTLSPETVLISRNGQAMVADFGMAPALLRSKGFIEGPSRRYLAPEVLEGDEITAQSDVYSFGALLHLLVCGMAPTDGGRPTASSLQPLLPTELDDLVARCMASNPSERPANTRAVRSQLLAIVETWGTPSLPEGEEWPFDDDLSIPATMEKSTKPAPAPTAPSSSSPASADDMFESAMSSSSAPAASSSPPSGGGLGRPASGLGRPASVSGPPKQDDEIDLNALLTSTTQSENQVWMVQKNNLDHGPFSTRELGQQIFAGKINPDDQVLNMDTGVRQRCVVWSEFTQIVEKAMEKRRQEQEAEALRKVETVEKSVGFARYIIAAVIVVVIGIIVGGYFLYRHATTEETVVASSSDDLIAAGGQMIKTGGGVLPMERSKRRRRGRRRRGRSGGGGGGGVSAEDAMNQAVDYGDLSGSGGQLSVGQITSVMNRNVRGLAGCMGGQSGRVSLDIVINGNGSVAGVSVSGASGSARSCIASRTRGIRFPSFGSPRMRASYFFQVGN